MYKYYQMCLSTTIAVPANVATQEVSKDSASTPVLSEFDKHHETLLMADTKEGQASELWHYFGVMQCNVIKKMDLVEWWQVSRWMPIGMIFYLQILIGTCTVISYPHLNCT